MNFSFYSNSCLSNEKQKVINIFHENTSLNHVINFRFEYTFSLRIYVRTFCCRKRYRTCVWSRRWLSLRFKSLSKKNNKIEMRKTLSTLKRSISTSSIIILFLFRDENFYSFVNMTIKCFCPVPLYSQLLETTLAISYLILRPIKFTWE